jgi:hypothetical protein
MVHGRGRIGSPSAWHHTLAPLHRRSRSEFTRAAREHQEHDGAARVVSGRYRTAGASGGTPRDGLTTGHEPGYEYAPVHRNRLGISNRRLDTTSRAVERSARCTSRRTPDRRTSESDSRAVSRVGWRGEIGAATQPENETDRCAPRKSSSPAAERIGHVVHRRLPREAFRSAARRASNRETRGHPDGQAAAGMRVG